MLEIISGIVFAQPLQLVENFTIGQYGFDAKYLVTGIAVTQHVCATGIGGEVTPDLATARGHMAINGNQVGEGTTGDILGHPYEALAWLANSLAERDQHLKSGEIVLLGSVVETQWVERGDEVNIEIEGVGGALVKFV